jgi:hypothetical protein
VINQRCSGLTVPGRAVVDCFSQDCAPLSDDDAPPIALIDDETATLDAATQNLGVIGRAHPANDYKYPAIALCGPRLRRFLRCCALEWLGLCRLGRTIRSSRIENYGRYDLRRRDLRTGDREL